MNSDNKMIAVIGSSGIIAIGLIFSTAFYGVTKNNEIEERKYMACVEAGNVWVDKNCLGVSADAEIPSATKQTSWKPNVIKPHFNNRYKNKKWNGCWIIPRDDGSCFWVPKMPDETW